MQVTLQNKLQNKQLFFNIWGIKRLIRGRFTRFGANTHD